MELVQPIKDRQKIAAMKEILQATPKTGPRDEAMFVMGINAGLRVSDLLKLTIGDVLDSVGAFRDAIVLKEHKTGKRKSFPLNTSIKKTLQAYLDGLKPVQAGEPLFSSNRGKPLSRVRFWQILNAAADKIGLTHVGTHTLRKTFGYHAFQRSKGNLALVQKLLNHSSSAETLRYIGLTQEELDAAYLDLNL